MFKCMNSQYSATPRDRATPRPCGGVAALWRDLRRRGRRAATPVAQHFGGGDDREVGGDGDDGGDGDGDDDDDDDDDVDDGDKNE